MTQLEKADAYSKALEKAKQEYNTTSEDRKQWLEELFPELRMNEDDMMRRELISFLLETIAYGCLSPDKWRMEKAKKWISWLKRQGKEEYALKSSKNEDVHKFMECIEKIAKSYELNLPHRGYDIYAFAKELLHWLENQGNKQAKEELDECKFMEGDWIVDKTDGQLFHIQKKREHTYEITDIHDNNYQVPCYSMNDTYRHWNIHDAICGDVLITVNDERPFIFKGCLDPDHPDSPVAYCGIDADGYFCRGGSINHWWTDNKVQPATKEQIDWLFQKMNDRS